MADTQTVYASIGNSDDKLTQARWAEFHEKFGTAIRGLALQVYGNWVSPSTDPWQNACIGFEIGYETSERLRRDLAELAAEYGQDSIAWAEADTRFITPVTLVPAVKFPPNTLADDVLGWVRDRELYSEYTTGTPVTINQDSDGTVRIVDPADVLAVDVALLRHPGLTGVSFDDGVLSLEAEAGVLRYQALHACDFGFTVVFRRGE